ncbi:hypothetical protein [Rhabdochlamydiaceae symbiont of Dictyostelium giganteum]|uniref:hypothetical protein n=1 Tax=Rhabdochlamydiaceae symbiont of Dictyostelium giganteum TaxID=3342349 RepID=UPI00384CC0E7
MKRAKALKTDKKGKISPQKVKEGLKMALILHNPYLSPYEKENIPLGAAGKIY